VSDALLAHCSAVHYYRRLFRTIFVDVEAWCEICSATDEKGMAAELGTGKYWAVGVYRLHFETGSYFDKRAVKTLYPHIDVSSVYLFSFHTIKSSVCGKWEQCNVGLFQFFKPKLKLRFSIKTDVIRNQGS